MSKPIKIMKKFRVGYSVKWNFNGTLEVEAENADDAEKKAEAKLDEMAGNNEFDDVSNFKAEFDGADVLDTEEVKGYGEECRHARTIAACSCSGPLDGEKAAKAVAEAVVFCRAHPVVCMGDGMISFDYDNSFGPTTTVDDVLERMNLRDWRVACDEFCKCMLRKGGFDPENFDWPTPLPHVMTVPEDGGTDVIARVCVTFKVDARTYSNVLLIVDKEDEDENEDEGEDAPATGEEICAHCDAVIRYAIEAGKHVVVCPECGTINPLCNECDPDSKRCSECKISQMCEELNKQRADALPKPEEE